MTIGQKIRLLRTQHDMTQSELCGDKITRNMLSAIENGKANPSLATIKYIASKLDIPAAYIVSDAENLFTFQKQHSISKIKAAFVDKRYEDVIFLISSIEEPDDELCFILAHSHFEIGKKSTLLGSLLTAIKHLDESAKFCNLTIYDTGNIERAIPLYKALVANIQSPLLELDHVKFQEAFQPGDDYELYKYISQDRTYEFHNKLFADHLTAKEMIKKRDYYSAVSILTRLEASKAPESYNAYAFFAIYTDLEICYRQMGDFEKAYRYSNKRISMLEGFKT